MSHTTAIKSTLIQSIPALQAALKELNDKHGIKCELLTNATPRAYSTNQQGMGVAPYVIHLKDCKYDIGLYTSDAGKGFEARTDFWQGHIAKLLGGTATSPESTQQAQMGLLYQTYGINAAALEARAKGWQTRRVAGKDGSQKLVIEGVA